MAVEMVEGAWYRQRRGTVVGPAKRRLDRPNDAEYPYEVSDYTFTSLGRFYGSQIDDRDLVERVNPDGTPYAEPAQKPPPTDSIEARQFGDNIHEAIEDAAESQVAIDNQLMQQAIMGKRGEDQRRIAEAVCVLGAKLLRKNNDYGSSAWKRPKLASHLDSSTAIRVRMSDKLERIESLAQKQQEVVGESLEDTLDDLVAYWILLKAAPKD